MKNTEEDTMYNGTWTTKQEWFIQNILTLLERQKTELTLLTRRVTDLEIEELKKYRKWLNEKENQSTSEEQNLF